MPYKEPPQEMVAMGESKGANEGAQAEDEEEEEASSPGGDEGLSPNCNEPETKLYGRRWLVLMATASLQVMLGFNTWYVPVADLLCEMLQIDNDDYNRYTQVNVLVAMVCIAPCSQLVARYSLRRSAYIMLGCYLISNTIKAACLSSQWQLLLANEYRYPALMFSETFGGVAKAISYCLTPKMAREWFANSENTLSQMSIYCGGSLGSALVGLIPRFVKSVDDMPRMSVVFFAASAYLLVVVTQAISRSKPKIAPSQESIVALTAAELPLSKALVVMLTNPSFMLLMLTLAINSGTLFVEQLVLRDLFATRQYDAKFCGTIFAMNNILQMIFMGLISYAMDKISNYLSTSRLSAIIFAGSVCALNAALNLPGNEIWIVVTSIITSITLPLVYTSIIKIMYVSSVGFLPEPTVGGIFRTLQQLIIFSLTMLVNPLRRLGGKEEPAYEVPLATFAAVSVALNLLYALTFGQPDPVELRERVLRRMNKESSPTTTASIPTTTIRTEIGTTTTSTATPSKENAEPTVAQEP